MSISLLRIFLVVLVCSAGLPGAPSPGVPVENDGFAMTDQRHSGRLTGCGSCVNHCNGCADALGCGASCAPAGALAPGGIAFAAPRAGSRPDPAQTQPVHYLSRPDPHPPKRSDFL